MMDQVVILCQHERDQKPFHTNPVPAGPIAVLTLRLLQIVVRQPNEPPGQERNPDALRDQHDNRQRPEVSGDDGSDDSPDVDREHDRPPCMTVKSESEVTQSCPTLSNSMDCRLLSRVFQFLESTTEDSSTCWIQT